MKTRCMIAFMSSLVLAVTFYAAPAQSPSDRNALGSFAVLAGTAVTCDNANISGDVGVNLGGSIGDCSVLGTIHEGDALAQQAFADFHAAYSALTPHPGDACTIVNGPLAGLVLPPGV
jgi:hypothetical protein